MQETCCIAFARQSLVSRLLDYPVQFVTRPAAFAARLLLAQAFQQMPSGTFLSLAQEAHWRDGCHRFPRETTVNTSPRLTLCSTAENLRLASAAVTVFMADIRPSM